MENAADRMAERLLRMAADDDVADSVKLAAIKDALDRAGLGAKTAVEVEVGPTKAYENLMTDLLAGGTRAESRARRGIVDEPLDTEVIEELDEATGTGWQVGAPTYPCLDTAEYRQAEPTPAHPHTGVPGTAQRRTADLSGTPIVNLDGTPIAGDDTTRGLSTMEDALAELSRTGGVQRKRKRQ
ncbi:hypothetical protein [Rhodococcus sp. NPDC127527]|uniref:hypothetical protein n=1 Tax=Rhodococcus sp. NPDC127527 TaxID=3345394 RepID=UPI00362F73C5